MNKRKFLDSIMCLFCLGFLCIADPFYGSYSAGEIPDYLTISKSKAELYIYINDKIAISINDSYCINYEDGIPFIQFNSSKYRFLFLQSSDFALLQGVNYKVCTFLSSKLGKQLEAIQSADIASSSSFLSESGNLYKAENICKNTFSGLPFVPGRTEGWAHCRLILKWDESSPLDYNMIIIGSGFVDINRPYLFLQNSRPHLIKITLNTGTSFYFNLLDTPTPQVLFIPKSFNSVNIQFCSVYKGSK